MASHSVFIVLRKETTIPHAPAAGLWTDVETERLFFFWCPGDYYYYY